MKYAYIRSSKGEGIFLPEHAKHLEECWVTVLFEFRHHRESYRLVVDVEGCPIAIHPVFVAEEMTEKEFTVAKIERVISASPHDLCPEPSRNRVLASRLYDAGARM